ARLAQERADAALAARRTSRARRALSWRGALFGTLAAAAIAGLVIAPRFMTLRTPAGAPAPVQERTQVVAADAQRAPPRGVAESAPSEPAAAKSLPERHALVAPAPPPAAELAKAAPPNVRAPPPQEPARARAQNAIPPARADEEARREARDAKSLGQQSLIASDQLSSVGANRAAQAGAAAAPPYATASPGGLIEAAARGDLASARQYLDDGADVN